MIVFKCDHCGLVIDQVTKVSVKYKIATNIGEDKDYHLMQGDLCEKCFDELMGFCYVPKEKAE